MNEGRFQGSYAPWRRLGYLLLGWGSVGCAYWLGGATTRDAFPLAPGAVERAIGYNPLALWPYLSFFALVPLAYAYASPGRTRWLCKAMIASAVLAGIVFQAFPTTLAMSVGAAEADPLTGTVLRWLVAFDTPRNCLPSLHVTLTMLAAAALMETGRPMRSVALICWTALIAWSVLALRRHGALDVWAGSGLALLAGTVTLPNRRWYYIRRRYGR